jgi:hypothetical protein
MITVKFDIVILPQKNQLHCVRPGFMPSQSGYKEEGGKFAEMLAAPMPAMLFWL